MRFPYMGTARVKYLISMLEHRRLVRRMPQRVSGDAADPCAAGESIDLSIETLPADEKLGSFQTSSPWVGVAGAVQRSH
ncbi:hypothetical protein SRS16CHR_04580 [Variovorax sp. SRS16]|nr:hypothetical protein SRS16CHR_04580 [Variovorax sp. SRS16]